MRALRWLAWRGAVLLVVIVAVTAMLWGIASMLLVIRMMFGMCA